MRGPMLRFVIVAGLLFLLVIFYATRLGDDPPAGREETAAPAGDSAQPASSASTAPVARSVEPDRDWFPDLSQRSVLTDGIGDSSTGDQSFGCDVDELVKDVEQVLGDLSGSEDSSLGRLVDTLAASADAELQVAAAVLQGELSSAASDADEEEAREAAAIQAMEAAVRLDPSNPTALWYASSGCAEGVDSELCGSSFLQSNVRAALHGNGAFWAREALGHFESGDRAAALEAIRRASAAPEFNIFLTETTRLLERALALAEDISYVERTLGAYAYANDLSRSADYVVLVCDPGVLDDPVWFDACLAFAERVTAEGSSITQQLVAAELLADLYDRSGRSADAERALALLREIEGLRLSVSRSDDVAAVLLTDERVLSLFMEEFQTAGELAAWRFVGFEVERLKQDPDYDPCPPDDEPVTVN